MSTLIMLKGLPNSGKTEYSTEWLRQGENRYRISWREILAILNCPVTSESKAIAIDAALRIMCNCIRNGYDIILDECNLFPQEYLIFETTAQRMGCVVVWKKLYVSLEELKRRNKINGQLLDEQIDRLYELYSMDVK